MTGTAFALVAYALLWGLAAEVADSVLGDPFEPLDVFTLAALIAPAILLWPPARRMLRRHG